MTRLQALRARSGESGFTLIEMMMAVAILGIIMAPIGAGFFVAFRSMDESSNRRRGSNDAQLLSIYLPPDVQSATDALVSGFTSSSCTGVSSTAIKVQLVASTNDSDYLDAADLNVVYFTQQTGTGANARYELVRKTCVGTITSHVVARNLASLTAVTVTRTPTTGTLARVSMQVTEATTPTDTTPYTFTVTASKRTS